MFEKNVEEEKKQQLGITEKIVEKLISNPNLTKEKVETLERIARAHPHVRERIYEFLKKAAVNSNKETSEERFPAEKEERFDPTKNNEEYHEEIKSALSKKESPFYKTGEAEQTEKINSMIENILSQKGEEPQMGLIHILQNVSKNTPNQSIKKAIIEGLNKIAVEKTPLKPGVEAALAYEKLVLREKNGGKLRLLSELHRKIMAHPEEVSPFTMNDEELTLYNIQKMKQLGSEEELKNTTVKYLKNILKHPNYLVKKWAGEALSEIKSER